MTTEKKRKSTGRGPCGKKRKITRKIHVQTLPELIQFCNIYKTNHMDSAQIRELGIALSALEDMKGLEHVKKSIMGQILYYLQEPTTDDYLHTVITGDAGSGKTHFAEILANIYLQFGRSNKSGNVVKVYSKDLIDRYCGGTANLTENAVKSAFGGILLIDDAYSISGKSESLSQFSKEYVDTLNHCLSEYKKDFICIIVGYTDSLDENLFALNQGLRRRFSWTYNLDSGNFTNTLKDIFESQTIRAGWSLADDAIPDGFFNKNHSAFIDSGCSTEILLLKCKIAHSVRVFGSYFSRQITRDDLLQGFESYKLGVIIEQPFSQPFGMYI